VEKAASQTLYWLELILEEGIGANQEGYKAYAGGQATVGHIYSGRANIERTQMISNLKFRNPKSMSSQI
jgi:hypothetical protein